jgi:hypothetical protein
MMSYARGHEYCRQKVVNTRADKGKISIRIEPEAMALIDKYRDPSGERNKH